MPVRDSFLQLHPKGVPLSYGLVVAGEDVRPLVVEVHSLDRHACEHPERQQVQTEPDVE